MPVGPSYEELAALNGELRATVGALTERLDLLAAENAELKRRLGQNSQNSSKPAARPMTLAHLRQQVLTLLNCQYSEPVGRAFMSAIAERPRVDGL